MNHTDRWPGECSHELVMHQADEVKSEKTITTLLVHHSISWRTADSVSSANVEGAQCRANLILLPDMTLVNISKIVYTFLILYSSGI